jgi:predicted permease
MSNFLLIALCIAAGVALRHSDRFPKEGARALGTVITHLSLPALVLREIPRLFLTNMGRDSWVPISMPWIAFGLTWWSVGWLGRRRGWSMTTTGALVLTTGLGNTSFIGYPLIVALRGQQALPIAVLVDQPGSFLVLSTLGVTAAARFGRRAGEPASLFRRIGHVVTFPPFVALVVSVAWAASGTFGEGILLTAIDMVARTLVPLALVVVGLQLRFDRGVLMRRWPMLTGALAAKLVVFPALFWGLYAGAFRAQGDVLAVTVLESGMAPMVTAAIIADEFGLDEELASLMVGVGAILSLATVPAWAAAIAAFG